MISYKDIVKGWNKFFFEERPTEGLALFRIFWMGLIFLYFLLDIPNVVDFYGPHAVTSLSTVKEQFPFLHANLFHLFKPGYNAVYLLLTVYGVSLLFSICGLFTRTSLIVALLCMTSFHQRNIWLLSSAELLMRTITLLLIFSPCGHTLSLDSLLSRYYPSFKRPKNWSIWSLRLIQIQISVIYLWTFWHKLKGNSWIDGSAVYYATRLEFLTNSTIPFILNSAFFLKLLTWGTLLIELSLGTLVWIKEFRKPVIILGVFFHLGIEFVMSIPFFELFMIATLMNYFTPEEMRAFVIRVKHIVISGINESTMSTKLKQRLSRTIRGHV